MLIGTFQGSPAATFGSQILAANPGNWLISGLTPTAPLTVRNSSQQNGTSSAPISVPWPPGTQAGDLLLILLETGAGFPGPITGWTRQPVQSTNMAADVLYRTLDAADILAGRLNLNFSTLFSDLWISHAIAFKGTGAVKEIDSAIVPQPGTPTTGATSVTTSPAVAESDTGIFVIMDRWDGGSAATSVASGSLLQNTLTPGSHYSQTTRTATMNGGAQTINFGYTLEQGAVAYVIVIAGAPAAGDDFILAAGDQINTI